MIDYFFIPYIIWRYIKGSINTIGNEIENLFIPLLLLCAVMGIFIISELTGLINSTLQILLTSTGFWISFISFIVATFTFFFIRGKISKLADRKLTGNISRYGSVIISLLHAAIVIYLIVLMLNWLPFGLFKESLQQSIIAGPILEFITL